MNNKDLIIKLNNIDRSKSVIIDGKDLVSIWIDILNDISIDNNTLIDFVDIYSNLGEWEKSDIFSLLSVFSISELLIFKEAAEFILMNDELGVSSELKIFVREVEFFIIKCQVFLDVINSDLLPMNPKDILSYKDEFYDYSLSILASKRLSEVNDLELSLILESLEWIAFTDKAKINFMPRVILYGLDCIYLPKKMDYVFDYIMSILKIEQLNQILYGELYLFYKQISNFKGDMSYHDFSDLIKMKELLNMRIK